MAEIGHNGGPSLDDDDGYPDRDGFVTIARSMRSHPIVGFGIKGPYAPAEAWIDLIMECRFREGRVVNAGVVMTISPGQLVGAVSWLAQRWKWTPKQVRTFLEKLTDDGMITKGYNPPAEIGEQDGIIDGNQDGRHKGKQSHFITICNYEIYQFVRRKRGQIEQHPEGQTTGQIAGQLNGKSPANEGQTPGNQTANEGQQYKEEHWNTGTLEQGTPEEEKKEEHPTEPGLGLVVAADAAPATDVTIFSPGELIPAERVVIEPYEAFRAYNDLAQRIGLPVARTLTPSRRKALSARLREHGPESWPIALANIERSAFLRGNNDRNWRADFDFIVQASRYAKLVDGVYGNGAHAGGDAHTKETHHQRMARLMYGDVESVVEDTK